VVKTTTAVDAGNFGQAKQDFEEFDQNWEKIEEA